MLVLGRLADLIWPPDWDERPEDIPDIGPGLQGVMGFRPGGNGWWNPGRLMRQVWSGYPDTLWGDYAFLHLLTRGFGSDAAHDPAEPEAVLARGQAFLDGHPLSPYRAFILFMMAQAAETRWSASLARGYEGDCAGGPEDDAPEAVVQAWRGEQERRWARAVDAYRAVVAATDANELMHRVASQQLLRVRAGYDTGARHFFDCYA
jgi:hypothetical protein